MARLARSRRPASFEGPGAVPRYAVAVGSRTPEGEICWRVFHARGVAEALSVAVEARAASDCVDISVSDLEDLRVVRGFVMPRSEVRWIRGESGGWLDFGG